MCHGCRIISCCVPAAISFTSGNRFGMKMLPSCLSLLFYLYMREIEHSEEASHWPKRKKKVDEIKTSEDACPVFGGVKQKLAMGLLKNNCRNWFRDHLILKIHDKRISSGIQPCERLTESHFLCLLVPVVLGFAQPTAPVLYALSSC